MEESIKVCFKISGEFITHHSRNLLLEGNWESAIRFLKDSFDDQMDYDLIIKILSGELELIGDSSVGVSINENKDLKYIDQINKMYGYYLKIGQDWYIPYAYVTSFGPDDIKDEYGNVWSKEDMFNGHRAKFYCEDRKTDKIICCIIPECGISYPVLFKLAKPGPPIWLNMKLTPQQSFDFALYSEDLY